MVAHTEQAGNRMGGRLRQVRTCKRSTCVPLAVTKLEASVRSLAICLRIFYSARVRGAGAF